MIKIKRKEKLDQEFADSSKVKINIISNKQDITIELFDMFNRKCIFYFKYVEKFIIQFDQDPVDTISHISKIEEIKNSKQLKIFRITHTFNTFSEIWCKEFWYETEY